MSPKEYDVINGRWLLPSAVDDILPPQAECFVKMQQTILKIILGYGYQLIHPPSVEFASALNISNSENLEEDMVHFNDYPTADVLGLRADFTPQAARIDARVLHNSGINRFCYCGEIFRAKRVSSEDMRNTVHIGAELFGDSSINSDMEIMELMLTCLRSFCTEPIVLFIGHATFAKRVLQLAKLSEAQERQYLKLLSAKSMDYVDDFVGRLEISSSSSASLRELLIQLPRLYGDRSILKNAAALISKLQDKQLTAMLQQVKRTSAAMQDKASIYIDLGEMPGNGYSYHNGLVFGAYLQNICFAEGGRYDAIGEHYGKGRPATGFSMDAKRLFYHVIGKMGDRDSSRKRGTPAPIAGLIFAPYVADGSMADDATPKDTALKKEVAALRSSGKRVVCALNEKQNAKELNCAKELIYSGGGWKIKSLT